jgi:hypothetical protein
MKHSDLSSKASVYLKINCIAYDPACWLQGKMGIRCMKMVNYV